MNKNSKLLFICLAALVTLISCHSIKPQVVVPLEPTITNINTGVAQQPAYTTPTEQISSDIQASPVLTPTLNIATNPESVTDGKLELSLYESKAECHKPGDMFSLMFRYENLTISPLILADYNLILEVMADYLPLSPRHLMKKYISPKILCL
jgi:hypothetical protein